MTINILAAATGLSDQDLLTRLHGLAGNEREATAELVAHLAALDARPPAYLGQGYSSLFSYCTQALRLAEDAACNRIEAARACRRFPGILDLLADGSVTLTSVRLLSRHLTAENHTSVLSRARGRSRREIETLVAELAPRPDAPTSVRKLPAPMPPLSLPSSLPVALPAASQAVPPTLPPPVRTDARPIVQPTAPERYRVQFTIGRETHDKLRRLQALLRREIPDGDAGAIFDRAVTLLLDKVERAKLGLAARPRRPPSIRPRTDKGPVLPAASRQVPRAVQRAVWTRDAAQCAFVSTSGHRCTERTFLEFHHVQPWATGGPATVGNISLRCRAHNQYEGELDFGPRATKRRRDPGGVVEQAR
jgi:hypothetical protein